MIWNNAKQIVVNGKDIQDAFCNSVHIWPVNVIGSYRVYIEWDPVKDDNITIDGMTWNGSAMTTAMIATKGEGVSDLDVSYNNGGTWTTMGTTDIEHMIAGNTESLQKYCRGVSFRMKPDWGFSQFTWKSDQYYAPTGYLKVTVNENGSESIRTIATKTVNQAANTTYTVNVGDS